MSIVADVELARFVPWDELPALMQWHQGEHFALVGPTNAGKTTAMLSLMDLRGYRLLVSTKPKDRTLSKLKRQGWKTISEWPPPFGANKVVLHAPITDTSVFTARRVGATVGRALSGAFAAGGWTIGLDDLQALNDTCGLKAETRILLLNARSSDVTVLPSTQRPRWVPREVWTQATHLLIWRCNDRDDLRTLSGLGHADTDRIRAAVQTLDWRSHECLYVNTRTGDIARTILPPP